MKARGILFALACGTGTGLVAATVATFLDWRLNPGGLFHNSNGTDWQIVTDTALSWFVPVAFVSTLLVAVALWAYQARHKNIWSADQ